MSRYVWRDNGFYDRATGEPMELPERSGICMPQVMSDIPEYRSPIDGRMIGSRSERREDLKRNGCVEAEPPKHKVFRKEKYARANNADHDPNHRRALTP